MREDFANIFSSLEIDAIGEILNISLGSSATAVSNMVDRRVNITTPSVEVVSFEDFQIAQLEPAIGVEITYKDGLDGKNVMLLKRNDIKAIVELLMSTEIPEEEFELNEMNISAICEVMNQMMGASSTALAEFLGEPVNISTPVAFEITDIDDFKNKYFVGDEPMVAVRFNLSIEDTVESEFINMMSVDLSKEIISSFGLSDSAAPAPAPQPQPVPMPAPTPQPMPQPQPVVQQPVVSAPPVAPTPAPQPAAQHPVASTPLVAPTPNYAEPKIFNSIPEVKTKPQMMNMAELVGNQSTNLGMMMSVPLKISVEIGRTRKPLKEVLEFDADTLVVLDKLAGEAVDIFVNGQCIAKGDVVVVDDYFGVRITEILKNPEIRGFN
jgi:flagellar motor switch protein FliN/FliY